MPVHTVFDGESVQQKLHESDVQLGDIIEYCPANQQGWVLYRVIERDGQRALEHLTDYHTSQLD